jgi:hypothetical protein
MEIRPGRTQVHALSEILLYICGIDVRHGGVGCSLTRFSAMRQCLQCPQQL